MGSKVQRPILETAIELFAAEGYFGVGIRDIAKAADVTPGSIFRLFDTKEKLFASALEAVAERGLEPAEFQKSLQSSPKAFAEVLHKALRRWYSSVTPQSARLMMYAALSKQEEWRETASKRTSQISRILAESIQREARKAKIKDIDAHAAARTLISALLNLKSTHALLDRGEKEREAVERIIHQWIQGLSLN